MEKDPLVSKAVSRRHFLQGVGGATAGAATAALIPTSESAAADANSKGATPVFKVNSAMPSIPSLAIIALNRIAFGPRPGDVAAFEALGSTDDERLTTYVDQQLAYDPDLNADPEYKSRLEAFAPETTEKTLEQLWADHYRAEGVEYSVRTQPLREIERLTFLRAVYSKWQLVEVLADFWHNHFNIYAWTAPIQSIWPHYDRDVIRAHMLGNFREMIEAVAKSPEMLYYLDNESNTVDGPNENWARELFELHTLGAENYYGVISQDSVPVDNEGSPLGYVDEDVYEATRCFTGWTVSDRDTDELGDTGQFIYVEDNHDRFQKRVLNGTGNIPATNIPAYQAPLKDGMDVLDLVAYHPGTARYICRKLCRRLISDNPPESIVASAAAVFRAQKNAPDQLKQVVRHILLSAEFRTTWGHKIKRPFEVAVSALRATNGDMPFSLSHGDSNAFMYYFNPMGQQLFRWSTPDGYPDYQSPWQSAMSILMRWRLLGWLVEDRDVDDSYHVDILAQTPSNIRTANGLADFWIERILNRPMDSSTRQIIVDFMAQDADGPDAELDFENNRVKGRLRTMVALILQSPDFNWR